MYKVYRELMDISERTPTNYRWALQNAAKKNDLTIDELENIVENYDSRLWCILNTKYEEFVKTWYTDEEGTTKTREIIIEFLTPQALEDVRLFADRVYPRTFCMHEYDCCGHWYNHWPRVEQLAPRVFKITQGSYQNV